MTIDRTSKYKVLLQNLPKDWEAIRNVFYDIDPADNIPEIDKYNFIFDQEDILWLNKGFYNLDLGWYGNDDFNNPLTGYCIHLYRGKNWNDGELLEKFRTKNKNIVENKIIELMLAIDKGDFENVVGYQVTEDNLKDFNDFDEYCIR